MRTINEFVDLDLLGCMVSHPLRNPRDIEGIPVYSIETMCKKYHESLVLLAVREGLYDEVIDSLKRHGMYNYMKIPVDDCCKILYKQWISKNTINDALVSAYDYAEDLSDTERLIFLSRQLKRGTIGFELMVSNHCNLNCQGCDHFSPMADNSFLDPVECRRDLTCINKIFRGNIARLILSGGEPLLHEHILDIMGIARDVLNNTSMHLITNGLLLPQMKKDFWRTMRELGIGLRITRYPVNFEYDYWTEYAKDCGIELVAEGEEPVKTSYRLSMDRSGQLDPNKMFVKCNYANNCMTLKHGRIYTCTISANGADILKDYIGKEFPGCDENSVDIYNADIDGIEEYLKSPIPMCRYCNPYKIKTGISWKTSNKTIDEWI